LHRNIHLICAGLTSCLRCYYSQVLPGLIEVEMLLFMKLTFFP